MDQHYHHALRHNASGVNKSDTWEVLYTYVTYNGDHNVVQEGPYKKVCHLEYVGTMLTWVGAGLTTVNWIAAAIIMLTTVAAYQYRINCEEDKLFSSIGKQYKEYVKHTWRLIPFVY